MGPIQSSVNQTLSVAGLLGHTSPKIKERMEAQAAAGRLSRAQDLYEKEQAKAYAEEYKKYQAGGGTKSGEEWLKTEIGEEARSNLLNQPKVAAARQAYETELAQYGTTPESRYYANLEYHQLASDTAKYNENQTLVRQEPKPTPQQNATQRAQEHLRDLQERRRAGRQPRIEDYREIESQMAADYRRRLMEGRNNG